MNAKLPPDFQRWMAEATRLTQAGQLQRATAVIQAALAGAGPSATAPMHDVIDVPAREIGAGPSAPSGPGLPVGQVIAGQHANAAGAREYRLFVPPVRPGQALPLVVMLHGCSQDPEDFARGTGMSRAALAQGFYALYPAQAGSANPQRCWNWFKHSHQARGRGEPALLAGMTREVMQRHAVDPQRVYVAGLSAGGAMAAILGAGYPDLYAAVGVHSGLAAGAATDLSSALQAMLDGAAPAAAPAGRRPPTIVFHGDRDSTVHPDNGMHVAAACAGAAQRETERARSHNGREFTRHRFRDAAGQVLAEHWVVHGAGHAWSGGDASGSYTDGRGPDATAAMLDFFFDKRLSPVA